MSTSTLKSATTDELRLQNYRENLERRNEIEVKDIELKHAQELERLSEMHTQQMEDMKKAYDVDISREAAVLEETLTETRTKNGERAENEKLNAERELASLRAAHRDRIEQYKKSSEEQYQVLQKQLQASAEALHEQARKTARKQGETDKS